MTRDEWIAAFAAEMSLPGPSIAEIRDLLDLAGRAAHASERTAAPLACWLAARSGRSLTDALEAADRVERASRQASGDPAPAQSAAT